MVGFAAIDPAVESLQKLLDATAARSLTGLRIGVPEDHFFEDCGSCVAETVRRALQDLEAEGAVLLPFAFPEAPEAAQWMANGGVNVPEGFALVHNEFSEWIDTLDASVRSRLSNYGAIDPGEYAKRLGEIEPMRLRAHARIDGFDVIATPTTRLTAPRADEVEDLEDYRRRNMAIGRNLMLMNLWDFPSITLPIGKDLSGLPIGLQLSGRRGSDDVLLGVARAVERALGTPREILGTPPLCS